ncbi:hypothetical protein A3F06_02025 [candidate division TM6 bacterium RIFCSPHIGHO2_12_FULL_36_22]|nr:MAG: hypothetical protein A3F06_02025 [candidate division TM6 bacterium RIFCSPHIGHO2_12_FULL_36_22]
MRESLRFEGKILSATISRTADRWFVSIAVEISDDLYRSEAKNQGVIGIDLGFSVLATLSTGKMIIGPKAEKVANKKLRHCHQDVSRKEKGSNNRRKAQMQLARCYAQIANIRSDNMHKATQIR